jgi:O-antigen/teichoic acid export membrane protein
VGFSSIVTGLVFSLIVTRTLSVEEFGTWSLINIIIGYMIVSGSFINYWTIREMSRGINSGNTSFISNLSLSLGIIPIYIAVVILFSENSNAIPESMFFGLILVPLYLISTNLSGINTSFQPQVVSKSLLVFETSRIPTALLFVYFLGLGIDGAIVAMFLAYFIKVIYQLFMARSKLKSKFQISYLRNWIKLSWLSLYSLGPNFFRTFDIALFTLISSSVIGIAFYAAAGTVGKLVSHTEKITLGLHPKLLSGGKYLHISENLSLVLLFGLPLTGISIVFSKPALYALNPIYQDAWPVVVFLALQTFFLAIVNSLQNSIVGIEKVDTQDEPTFRNFIGSNLFWIPTYRYIKLGIYLITLTVVFLYTKGNHSEITIITYWALIGFLIEAPYAIFLWIKLKKITKINFPYASAIKYLTSTGIFMLVFWLTSEKIIIYHTSIFDFLPTLILQFLVCLCVYVGFTYLIDNKFRFLLKSVIQELFKK